MHTAKTIALALSFSLTALFWASGAEQDPFTINIKKSGEQQPAETEQAVPKNDTASEVNAAEEVGFAVEEASDGEGIVVNKVQETKDGEEELELEEGAQSGDVSITLTDEGGEDPNGDTAGDSQGDGWTTVEIPQIKGSIKMPDGWHLPTAEQLLKATEDIEFPSEDAKAAAELGALATGRMSLVICKNPEPNPEVNPGVSITWEPLPMAFEQIPLEARSEAIARVLAGVALPELKAKDEGFQLLEGPKAINDEGGGAWVTFRSTMRLKNGNLNEAIVRLYVLPARNHVITAQITAPADREKGEEVLPDLWAIFESLSYAK